MFWIITVLVLLLDRIAKLLTLQHMAIGQRVVWISGVLELRYTQNTGMALGILSGYTLVSIVLPLIAVTAGVLMLRKYKLSHFMWIAAALIFGGFLANLFDRVWFGFVVDMVYFPWLPYFVCNVADIAITFGAVMTAISLLFRPKDWQLKLAEGTDREQNPDS